MLFYPKYAMGDGPCLNASAGYMFLLGGNGDDLKDAPSFGAGLEYNFSWEELRSLALTYIYSHHGIEDQPSHFKMDQHVCLLGYRFGMNWRRLNIGTHIGMGASVMDPRGGYAKGSEVLYAVILGSQVEFRIFNWLHIGPHASFLMTTDMDKWIFGGKSNYFVDLGGRLSIYF